jgi:hypothetical protein
MPHNIAIPKTTVGYALRTIFKVFRLIELQKGTRCVPTGLNSKAGYTCAVVPQFSSGEMLAKREESIYGFAPANRQSKHNADDSLSQLRRIA